MRYRFLPQPSVSSEIRIVYEEDKGTLVIYTVVVFLCYPTFGGPTYAKLNCAASSLGLKTPRSVIMPVMNSAGVTSKAGL